MYKLIKIFSNIFKTKTNTYTQEILFLNQLLKKFTRFTKHHANILYNSFLGNLIK